MRIDELFSRRTRTFSCEVFTPRENEPESFFRQYAWIAALSPDFVSVACAAWPGAEERTRRLALWMRANGIEPLVHLVCGGRSREAFLRTASRLFEDGIGNVVVLRGDPEKGKERFEPHPDGFRYASEAVEEIRRRFGARPCIGVAGHPETHPDAKNAEEDLRRFKEKVDAGADFVITQLFLEAWMYRDFRDALRSRGVGVPILPGIYPLDPAAKTRKILSIAHASVPAEADAALAARDQDRCDAITANLCRDLVRIGVPGLHMFTVNDPFPMVRVLRHLERRRGPRD